MTSSQTNNRMAQKVFDPQKSRENSENAQRFRTVLLT